MCRPDKSSVSATGTTLSMYCASVYCRLTVAVDSPTCSPPDTCPVVVVMSSGQSTDGDSTSDTMTMMWHGSESGSLVPVSVAM